MESIVVDRTSSELVTKGDISYWSIVLFYHPKTSGVIKNEEDDMQHISNLSVIEQKRYEALVKWRTGLAAGENIPPFIIAHNKELNAISRLNPTTPEELLLIKGIRHRKIEKYGAAIILVLKSCAE